MQQRDNHPVLNMTFFMTCIFAMAFLMMGSRICSYQEEVYAGEDSITARVVEVLNQEVEEFQNEYQIISVYFTAELTSGDQKGDTVDCLQYIDEMLTPVPDPVEQGDSILLLAPSGDDYLWVYADVNGFSAMAVMVVLFLLGILLIGRGKGIATIASLLFTMGAIFYVYVPGILGGKNIYVLTIVIALFIVFSSLILLNGTNIKTFCAILGNVGGTLLAGVLAIIFNNAIGITGVVDQDYAFLTMLSSGVSIDLQAVVWGGILIGSLGAIMDVSMSIASAMQELALEMEDRSFQRLTQAGMRIGQDAIGTMTNTLILAYVGGSLAMVLLFTAYNRDMMILLNMEMLSIEIIQAVVGSMGILLAVPLTVFASAWVHVKLNQGKRSV